MRMLKIYRKWEHRENLRPPCKQYCMQCEKRNSLRRNRCRKCGSYNFVFGRTGYMFLKDRGWVLKKDGGEKEANVPRDEK